MHSEKFHWFELVFRLRGSVIPAIANRVLLSGFLGFIVSGLHYYKIPVANPVFGTLIPSVVIGLLLVFRTNTAYERYWEGRKAWGTLVNNVRNLSRQIWVSVVELEPEDREKKIATLRLLVAFSVATKLHLRQKPVNQELEILMTSAQYHKLKKMNSPPLEIAFWIEDYLQKQYQRRCLNAYQLIALQDLLNSMVDVLGACERILKTPIPIAYAIHLKQMLFIYCALLPFNLVEDLGWWTGAFVALVSFIVFGVEEIGIEIENPFGYDANDLALTAICQTMLVNIEDLISLSPSVHDYVDNSIARLD